MTPTQGWYTSPAFTNRLEAAEVRVSMDGRGRTLDNVFVERLWRTVKYEYVYLEKPTTGVELQKGLTEYFRFYNEQRSHYSENNQAPVAVYRKGGGRYQ